MPFDISEIKNLLTEEKLRIIDELWESIDTDEVFEEESPEVIAMLEERMAKYERGEGKFYTVEEIKAMLEKNSKT
jgi:putative addiction module component (TIGR02574 family)